MAAPRAIGSLTVSFGLVAIPVKLYTATQSQNAISFNMLHKKCGTRVKQQPADEIDYVPTAAMLAGDFTAFASPACNSGRQIALRAPFVQAREQRETLLAPVRRDQSVVQVMVFRSLQAEAENSAKHRLTE